MNTFKHSNNNEDLRLIAPKLAAMQKMSLEESFKIPAGYFEQMQISVVNHPLIKISNDFVAPELYFDHLPEHIMQHALVNKQNPFVSPEHYFEKLPLHIEQRLGINKAQKPLEVPEGYFEQLPLKIQDRLYKERKETKVYWLTPSPQYRMILAAAVVTIIVAMIFYLKLMDSPIKNKQTLALNKITKVEINTATDEFTDYDENMIIEAIDQPEQIEIANHSIDQEQMKTELTEYLIEHEISIDDIAAEI
ncbi:MAG TPA: hypothetical protein PK323_02800 [Bacteroidia bacterium]|nr:hypothetical protein [Bacteroidia bacterium]